MPTPPVSDSVLQQTWLIYEQSGQNQCETARTLGLSRNAVQERLRRYRDAAATGNLPGLPVTAAKPFEAEALPNELPTADELIARRKVQFERKKAAKDARKLIRVDVRMDGPIGIVHFGDPHVDDDGTDLGLIERHVNTVNRTEGLFGANVGDLQNAWVGRLARLWAEQSTSAQEAWVLTEWLFQSVQWLYLIKGNHDCHDAETECLTRRGWLRHDEIADTDFVLSLNPETGVAEWSPILKRIVHQHDGDMVRLNGPSLSFNVTPNHRVLQSTLDYKMRWRPWTFTTADKLPARMAAPVSGSSAASGVALSDDQIALAGWVLTDGTISWTGQCPHIALYQSKDGAEIDRLLSDLGLEHRRAVRQREVSHVCGRPLVREPRPQVEWHLTADASRRVLEWLPKKGVLPTWANDLSDHQFSVLLDALVAGDGCWDGKDPSAKNCAVLHGERDFLGSVQAAAVQHGWRARLAVARGKDWRLNLAKKDRLSLWTVPVTQREHYSGAVWCLTVPRGNFMVRRDGIAHFSGNCWTGNGDPLDWMKRAQPGVIEPHGARMGLHFPNGRQVRINARHDFTGHSQWNTAHGPAKAAQMGWRDHVLTCGHTHVSGYQVLKDPATGLISHALRVGSYKTYDRYAEEKGLPDQNIFPACVTVIDPQYADNDPRLITTLFDVEEGASYLTWKRQRAAA